MISVNEKLYVYIVNGARISFLVFAPSPSNSRVRCRRVRVGKKNRCAVYIRAR